VDVHKIAKGMTAASYTDMFTAVVELTQGDPVKFEELLNAMADVHDSWVDNAMEAGGEMLANKMENRATLLRDTASKFMGV